MLNGIIFVKDPIISLDIKKSFSKHFTVSKVFKSLETSPDDFQNVDFIIIDSDFFSEQVLLSNLNKLRLGRDVKIIALTSQNTEISNPCIKLVKPFCSSDLIQAIQF